MKLRWYFSALIITLAIVSGAVFQQQISVPNQEIVVQFGEEELNTQQTEYTISTVKAQLLKIGVSNIQVKTQKGALKITYYSSLKVSEVEGVLANEVLLALSNVNHHSTDDNPVKEIPFKEASITYDINVSEIQNRSHTGWGFDDAFVLHLEPKSDRFSNPDVFTTFSLVETTSKDIDCHVALKANKANALAIDIISYIIPEVRAGPSSLS